MQKKKTKNGKKEKEPNYNLRKVILMKSAIREVGREAGHSGTNLNRDQVWTWPHQKI
jgi:hypothetical protein